MPSDTATADEWRDYYDFIDAQSNPTTKLVDKRFVMMKWNWYDAFMLDKKFPEKEAGGDKKKLAFILREINKCKKAIKQVEKEAGY